MLLNRTSPIPDDVKWEENEQRSDEKLRRLSEQNKLLVARVAFMEKGWQTHKDRPIVSVQTIGAANSTKLQPHSLCRLQDEVSSQVSYFCGYGPECNSTDKGRRLAVAMRTVEKTYAIVGVLDDLDATIRAFEAYVPRCMNG